MTKQACRCREINSIGVHQPDRPDPSEELWTISTNSRVVITGGWQGRTFLKITLSRMLSVCETTDFGPFVKHP